MWPARVLEVQHMADRLVIAEEADLLALLLGSPGGQGYHDYEEFFECHAFITCPTSEFAGRPCPLPTSTKPSA